MDMIRLFVGYDPREAVAFDVFVASVIQRSSLPVSITPLALNNLRQGYAEAHTDGSNDFIYSRFLVPSLCNFNGWAIFADGDMLCQADLAELWASRDPSKAVQVVKHDYKTKHPVKYLGAKNEDYPRKNWSSVILWNCGHPANQRLQPDFIESCTGSFLHRFSWLDDLLVGELEPTWNWLVGEYDHNPFAKIAHFTLGTPCFQGYTDCDHADAWYHQLAKLLDVPQCDSWYLDVAESEVYRMRDGCKHAGKSKKG